MIASILVIEDDRTLANNIRKYLTRYDYHVTLASTGKEALAQINNAKPEVVLLDLNLPDFNGLDLLKQMRGQDPLLQVIMMTGTGNEKVAVDAMKAGAQDYLAKPIELKELKLLLDKMARAQKQATALSYYHDRQAEQSGLNKIIGESAAIQSVKSRIAQFVESEQHLQDQDPPSVLIMGETGTGKELVARAFHFDGPRKDQPFVELNCAAIPAHLLEAELFGYERGAFTDAKQRKFGLVDTANGGTLFLDEIGEMDTALQAKLLTLLENHRIRRLGSTKEHTVNVRIIAATNQNLDQLVAEGKFRRDLFYRLSVIQIQVPPLNQRGQDIVLLADYFLQHHAQRYRKYPLQFESAALQLLKTHSWPGNIRELRNTIEQAVILTTGNQIKAADLLIAGAPDNDHAHELKEILSVDDLNLEQQEIRLVKAALQQSDGNITKAAEKLGLSRDTLRYRLNKYNLEQYRGQ